MHKDKADELLEAIKALREPKGDAAPALAGEPCADHYCHAGTPADADRIVMMKPTDEYDVYGDAEIVEDDFSEDSIMPPHACAHIRTILDEGDILYGGQTEKSERVVSAGDHNEFPTNPPDQNDGKSGEVPPAGQGNGGRKGIVFMLMAGIFLVVGGGAAFYLSTMARDVVPTAVTAESVLLPPTPHGQQSSGQLAAAAVQQKQSSARGIGADAAALLPKPSSETRDVSKRGTELQGSTPGGALPVQKQGQQKAEGREAVSKPEAAKLSAPPKRIKKKTVVNDKKDSADIVVSRSAEKDDVLEVLEKARRVK